MAKKKSLELRRHGRDKLRATVGVDRRGQSIQRAPGARRDARSLRGFSREAGGDRRRWQVHMRRTAAPARRAGIDREGPRRPSAGKGGGAAERRAGPRRAPYDGVADGEATPEKRNMFVYKLKDIEQLYSDMKECWNAAFNFNGWLRHSTLSVFPQIGSQMFAQLCALPQIRREMDRLRENQEDTLPENS